MNDRQLVANLENLRAALNGDVLKGVPVEQAMRVAGVQIELIIKKVSERPHQNYDEYMQSPEWELRRQAMLHSAGGKCQVCNGTLRLNVHHRTYERLGHETPDDLIVLCHGCHQLFHEHRRLATAPAGDNA